MTLSVTEIIQCSIFLTTECMSHFLFGVSPGNPWDESSRNEFFQGIFCKEEKIAKARYWVTESHMRKVALTVGKDKARSALGQQSFPSQLSMPVAMGMVALRTSERLRRQDLGQSCKSGSEEDGLENVGKAEATRSRSSKFSHMTVALITSERVRRQDLGQQSFRGQPHDSGNEK